MKFPAHLFRPRPDRALRGRRDLKLSVETCEPRLLLATGAGFIAGTAFIDANNNNTLDKTDAYLPGALMVLYQADGTTQVATQFTDAKGAYDFTGLAAGTYVVKEIPPAGYANSGTSYLSELDKVLGNTINTITVQVVDPNNVFDNYRGVNQAAYEVGDITSTGGPLFASSIGALNASLGTAASAPGYTDLNPGFTTVCVDLAHQVPFATTGLPFQVLPEPVTSLTPTISADHAGRIAYLFNHYSTTPLTPVQAGALQTAIWELEYDADPSNMPDFNGGNFRVAYDPAYAAFTSPAAFSAMIAQATAYFNESSGQSEQAIYLDYATLHPNTNGGGQGMLATGSFDFANIPTIQTTGTGKITGHVFQDLNGDCIQQVSAGETGLANVPVTLTGTVTGAAGGTAITPVTVLTDASGTYTFPGLKPGIYTVTEGAVPAADGIFVHEGQTSTTPGAITIVSPMVSNIILPQGQTSTDSFCEIPVVCNTSDITNISYVINGKTYSSLGGNVHQGDHVTVNFTVAPGHADQLSLVSYVAPAPYWTNDNASQQFIYQSSTQNFGPGAHSLSVDVPNCYFQVDFVCGPPITQFNPCNNVTYHGQNRFIDSANGGTTVCVPECDTTQISGITYLINGTKRVTSLGGNVHQGDTVEVDFTVAAGHVDQLSLVSYTSPDGSFNLSKQYVYQSSTQSFGPGAHSLVVKVPNNYFQVDFVCGPPITHFDPNNGVTYHGQNRFIDSASGGTNAPASQTSTCDDSNDDDNSWSQKHNHGDN